jgi:hypothetical protein
VNVHLNSEQAPLFVAFRDGFTDATWKPVTPSTAMTFMVHGPYSVTVVCSRTGGGFLMWQASHTTDDDTTKAMPEPTLSTPCAADPVTHTVSGMAQSDTTLHLGDQTKTTTNADKVFSFSVPDGTYFLTATAVGTTKVAVQRVVVNGSNVALPTQVDVLATGATPNPIMLEVDNPPNPDKSTEKVSATVEVTPKDGAASSQISQANLDTSTDKTNQVMSALSLPDANLMDGDTQTATMIGKNSRTSKTTDMPVRNLTITTKRLRSHPFQMGDEITQGMIGNGISLPTSISNPATPNFDNKNRLSVSLPALPALDDMTLAATGTSTSGATITYSLHITASYFSSTLLARPVFDTDIMGFMAAWTLDFSKPYTIDIASQRDVFDDDDNFVGHEMSAFHEDVAAP